jgi:hypothetical protein
MGVTARMPDSDPTQAALQSMYRNKAEGNDAYADLDAIGASLTMTGGAGVDAETALATFDIMGDVYQEAVSSR